MLIKSVITQYNNCRTSGTNFFVMAYRHLLYRMKGKNIKCHQKVTISGVENITTNGVVSIGIDEVGFMLPSDKTFINVRGRIQFNGPYSIGRGCRIDIGPNGHVIIGSGGYVNALSTFIILHRLVIGDRCAISWNCQFLDDDFHQLNYEGKSEKGGRNDIIIGDHVWIGSNVCVYKGSIIPGGCVVAANSVVRDSFDEENVLLAGNPARIIKRNISWE